MIVAVGACWLCGKMFTFNPSSVPSFNSEPLCEHCMEMVNEELAKQEKKRFRITVDAYQPTKE